MLMYQIAPTSGMDACTQTHKLACVLCESDMNNKQETSVGGELAVVMKQCGAQVPREHTWINSIAKNGLPIPAAILAEATRRASFYTNWKGRVQLQCLLDNIIS